MTEPDKLIKNEKGDVTGVLIHDIEFTLTQVYKSTVLHAIYHRLIREDNGKTDER